MHGGSRGGELNQNVVAFRFLLDFISQLANAPLLFFVNGSAGIGDGRFHLVDQYVDLFLGGIGFNDEQLFVNPHSSSLFKPRARRLNFVMDFSTPSAIMDSTARDA